MPSICIISITRLNREQNYCFEFSREHFASERSSSATLKARSDKFWRFHVELSHFELGWSYVEHVVHVPHRSSTLYLASWLRPPWACKLPFLSFSLFHACPSFRRETRHSVPITEPITFERTWIFASSLRFVAISKIEEQYMKINPKIQCKWNKMKEVDQDRLCDKINILSNFYHQIQ